MAVVGGRSPWMGKVAIRTEAGVVDVSTTKTEISRVAQSAGLVLGHEDAVPLYPSPLGAVASSTLLRLDQAARVSAQIRHPDLPTSLALETGRCRLQARANSGFSG